MDASPTIWSAVILAAEKAINQALAFDPATRQRLSALSESMAVVCTQPKLTLYVTSGQEGLSISRAEQPVATTLTGTGVALWSLATAKEKNVAGSGVQVSGNLEVLQRWQAILSDIDVDWQGLVSHYTNDFIGQAATQAINKLAAFTQTTHNDMLASAQHYFSDERRWVPHPNELDHFYSEIKATALACERLEAKLREVPL